MSLSTPKWIIPCDMEARPWYFAYYPTHPTVIPPPPPAFLVHHFQSLCITEKKPLGPPRINYEHEHFVFKCVKWVRPPADWVKLNTDGCSKGNPGKAGGGGLFRDARGNWIAGFNVYIGRCFTALQAELHAALAGLKMARKLGFKKLILEVDCATVVKLLDRNHLHDVTDDDTLNACKSILNEEWEVRVQHVYREGNKAADRLANESLCNEKEGLSHEFDSPPEDLSLLIEKDKIGIGCLRKFII